MIIARNNPEPRSLISTQASTNRNQSQGNQRHQISHNGTNKAGTITANHSSRARGCPAQQPRTSSQIHIPLNSPTPILHGAYPPPVSSKPTSDLNPRSKNPHSLTYPRYKTGPLLPPQPDFLPPWSLRRHPSPAINLRLRLLLPRHNPSLGLVPCRIDSSLRRCRCRLVLPR